MYMLSTVISQTGECNAQHATDPCFLNQWGYSTLLLIIIGIGLVYLLFKKRKFLVDNLKWIAGTVFIAGFLIYWYAFNEGGSDSNSIALTFRSALSSMEMFASHSDLLEVPEDLCKILVERGIAYPLEVVRCFGASTSSANEVTAQN